MSYALEDARRRKQARPLYLELCALGLELAALEDGRGGWRLEVTGLRSLSPAHADRVRARVHDHRCGLLWIVLGEWDKDLAAIQREAA